MNGPSLLKMVSALKNKEKEHFLMKDTMTDSGIMLLLLMMEQLQKHILMEYWILTLIVVVDQTGEQVHMN